MRAATRLSGPVEIVFDGPPEHKAGRFVEVERNGTSISFGKWLRRGDGMWALTLPGESVAAVALADALEALFTNGGLSLKQATIAEAALRLAGRLP